MLALAGWLSGAKREPLTNKNKIDRLLNAIRVFTCVQNEINKTTKQIEHVHFFSLLSLELTLSAEKKKLIVVPR